MAEDAKKDDNDWGDGGPPVIGEEPPADGDETQVVSAAEGTPPVPTAALLAEAPETVQPGDITVAVKPPHDSFTVYGVTVTQEPSVVSAEDLANLRRAANEANVELIEGTT